MAQEQGLALEITSFNLADLDIDALDTRLELTAILPQYIICEGNCGTNVTCNVNSGCVCHVFT
jgi:hypothetical protein